MWRREVVFIVNFNFELEVIDILFILIKFKCILSHALAAWFVIVVVSSNRLFSTRSSSFNNTNFTCLANIKEISLCPIRNKIEERRIFVAIIINRLHRLLHLRNALLLLHLNISLLHLSIWLLHGLLLHLPIDWLLLHLLLWKIWLLHVVVYLRLLKLLLIRLLSHLVLLHNVLLVVHHLVILYVILLVLLNSLVNLISKVIVELLLLLLNFRWHVILIGLVPRKRHHYPKIWLIDIQINLIN